jgi:hypothetical protein
MHATKDSRQIGLSLIQTMLFFCRTPQLFFNTLRLVVLLFYRAPCNPRIKQNVKVVYPTFLIHEDHIFVSAHKVPLIIFPRCQRIPFEPSLDQL